MVKIRLNERRSGHQITDPSRGFGPVELTLFPGRNRVLEEAFTILAKNCPRLKGAITDGQVQVIREDGNEHLLVDFKLPGPITFRGNRWLFNSGNVVELEESEFAKLRKDPRFEALLQEGTIEFLGRS
jgi:hypothetical protein